MAGFSNNMESKVMSAVFGGVSLTALTNVYVALCNNDPGDTAAGAAAAEVPGAGSYARQLTTAGTDWDVASGDPTTATTNKDLLFNMAGEAPGTATHFALWTTVSGVTEAEYIGGDSLQTAKAYTATDQINVGAGNAIYSIGPPMS